MATNIIDTTWSFITSLVSSAETKIHFTETSDYYDINTQNGQIVYGVRLFKVGHEPDGVDITQNTSDVNDFEANYKSSGNALEKAAVKAEISQDLNVNVQSATVSKKLRYDQMTTNQSLTQDVYTTVYEYTGSGSFFGCYFNVANDDIDIKVTVDGEVLVSDFNVSNLPAGNKSGGAGGSIFLWRAEGDEINFQPPSAIAYATSIKIELKAHHNSSSKRKMTFGYTVLTKET